MQMGITTDKYIFSLNDVHCFVFRVLGEWCDEGEIDEIVVRGIIQDLFFIFIMGGEIELFMDDPFIDLLDGQPVSGEARKWLTEECNKMFAVKVQQTIGSLDRLNGVPNLNQIGPTDVEISQSFPTHEPDYGDVQKLNYDQNLAHGLGS